MFDLNNREIASLTWLAVLLGWGLCFSGVRRSAIGVVRTFFVKRILLVVVAMATYVVLCVVLLAELCLWQPQNLKTTLVWTVTFAFAAMFELDRVTEEETYFRRTAREIIGLSAAITFIAEFFTFSLVIELLLIPILALLAGMLAMSETRKEWESGGKLAAGLLFLILIVFIARAVYLASQHWAAIATAATVRVFFLPVLLSFLYMPFIYVLSVYATYDRLFKRLSFRVTDKALLKYAKLQAVLSFHCDLEYLRRWVRSITLDEGHDRNGIVTSIQRIKSIKKRELNPPSVAASDGWSPYEAMEFLRDEGLNPGDYHYSHGEWFAATPYLELSKDLLPDNIAYYVEGEEITAKRLKLILNVNNPENSATSDKRFTELSAALVLKAIGREFEPDFFLQDGARSEYGNGTVSVERDVWSGGISGGYSRRLGITHID